MTILITGGCGYLGSKLVKRLATRDRVRVVSADIREPTGDQAVAGVTYAACDVRAPEMAELIAEHRPNVVVHLAAIVSPGKDSNREFEYSVDVEGSKNVLDACLESSVRRIIVTSSGAAYGYHPDNPEWLTEEDPVRGNQEFAYAWHKRLVEEMLAEYRNNHTELEQVVFRVGTILGSGVANQITNLFDKPRIIGIRGGDDRFVFIWDEDVVGCLEHAIFGDKTGIYNVAGDGALSLGEIAAKMNKRYIRLPAGLVRTALAIGKPLGLTRYGPEQVRFLQYRPVLDNTRLKNEFGYVPQKTSAEVFQIYMDWAGSNP